MYNCIIFDIDGTIIDTEKAVISSLQRLLKAEMGKEYSADELSFVLGIPGTIALQRLNVSDIYNANQKWNEYIKDYYGYISVFPGLEDIIKKIHSKKIKTGIVTSKTKQELIEDFYPFGLQGYFDYIVCADDTKRHKPEPEPILKCIELIKADPCEIVYIGDTIYDMQCADRAGIDFALALWGTKSPGLNAKIKLRHPIEILDVIHS